MPPSQGASPASASCSASPTPAIETSTPAAAREEAGSSAFAIRRISPKAPAATATISGSSGPPIACSPARSAISSASRARSGAAKSPAAMR